MRNLLCTSSIVSRRCNSNASSKSTFGAFILDNSASLIVDCCARGSSTQRDGIYEGHFQVHFCPWRRPYNSNDKYTGMTFKTIFGHDGTEYAYTPGQSYGMKFIPGKTIKYKIPLSQALGDARSTLTVAGNRYIATTTVDYDHDGIKSRQISHGVTIYDIRNKTCSGTFTMDLDYSRSGAFSSSWALHCDIVSTECDIQDGIVGD